MIRRDFLALALGAMTAPSISRAQASGLPVIGILNANLQAESQFMFAGFIRGLGESGFVVGRDVTLMYRFAEGRYERLPGLAMELVRRPVTVIVAGGGILPVRAAKEATSKIPIVFTSGVDPVKAGIVSSLNRPGANITGVMILIDALEAKRFGLLHELLPDARIIGRLVNPKSPVVDLDTAARQFGVEFRIAEVNRESELEGAFATFVGERAQAVFLGGDPVLVGWRKPIIALAARHRLPVIGDQRAIVDEGGLASYGPNLPEAYRQAGLYVARILRGASPGDLPIQQPTLFELVVNLKTAKTLGLTIPPTLLARADAVIE